jgi:ABC-type transport system involved in multi-copper enzyme maturation permease subunit
MNPVRRNQLATVVRLELRKNFFRLRGLWVYLLAFAPAFIILMHGLFDRNDSHDNDTEVMAVIFQMYYLRVGIFIGCLGIFTRLFRGDVMERSLHYYFLAPVRRELLVIGKWLAGATAASFVFGLGVLASFLIMYLHQPNGTAFLASAQGVKHFWAYLGVTVLATLGYGSLFLLTGMVFKNPVVPAVVIASWEAINHVLPNLLKKFSVIFYLEPLCPVEMPTETGLIGLFMLPADPLPGWLAVVGLLAFCALVLAYTAYRIKEVEISYGTD